jgi:ADP-L-glycero-D-manno-heptose 6-epimerase
MKNILITGGSGFIGSHLVNHFLELEYEVFYTGRNNENNVRGTCVGYNFANIDWFVLPKIEAVVHMAAITDTTLYDRNLMFKVNVQDSADLFNAAIGHGCLNIVYASSCGVYGNQDCLLKEDMVTNPLNPYAESKQLLDTVAMGLFDGANMVGLRFSNVYGPNEQHKGKAASMVSRIKWQMEEGDPKLFKYGEQKRDWVYYKDVIQAVELAIKTGKSGIYNIGSGISESFNEIVRIWNEVLKLTRTPVYIDNPFEGKYQNLTQVDLSKAGKELNYNSKYRLQNGIEDYFLRCKQIEAKV